MSENVGKMLECPDRALEGSSVDHLLISHLMKRTTDEFNKWKWRLATHQMPKNHQDVTPLIVDVSSDRPLKMN
jgi:hypothetical protein